LEYDDDDDDDDDDDNNNNNKPGWANLGCGRPLQGCKMYSHQPRMLSHTPVIEVSGHPHSGLFMYTMYLYTM
jgi:hypothetical protein